MKKDEFGLNRLEEEICWVARDEGLGSIYERVMLKRFFEGLAKEYNFSSVLEYHGLATTWGIDNITFLKLGKEVTLVEEKIERVEKNWPFRQKPRFCLPQKGRNKFDLVWNFAVVQLKPGIIDEMMALSNKFVLIFVPNFLNWGMPLHELYHLLTQTSCRHAERGSLLWRTPWGIARLAKSKKMKILKGGFIDIPPLPDIGFSLKELKGQLGIKGRSRPKTKKVLQKVNRMTFLEKLPRVVQLPFAHHLYLFGAAQ